MNTSQSWSVVFIFISFEYFADFSSLSLISLKQIFTYRVEAA